MHCSLCIPEIVSLIFYETLNGAEQSFNHLNRDSAQTLAGLARTCKAFRDPALDLLWKSQCTVMNVLNCMPGDIWKLLDDTDTEEVRLKRPVLPSYPDCAAFYEMLRMCLPPEPLFPKIESLLWETSDAALLPSLSPFHRPSLDLFDGIDLPVGFSFVSSSRPRYAMPFASGSLHSDLGWTPGALRDCILLCEQLTRLESLEVPCLDAVALDHLAKRPVLDFVHLDDQTPLSPVLGLPSKTEVPSSCDIDVLTLTVTDARAATESNDSIPEEHVRKTAVREVYNGVAANCNHASLDSLSIALLPRDTTDTAADPEQIALYAVPGTHLFPLFTLTTLTSVTLAGPVGLDLDDAAAAEIARAWPRITSLDLAGSAFIHVPPRTTLCALLAFARGCPHLWRLSLPINARSVPKWRKPQTAAEARPTQRRLRSLHVGESPYFPEVGVGGRLAKRIRGGTSPCARKFWRAGGSGKPLRRRCPFCESEPPDASLATIPVPAFLGPFYSLKAAEERGERKNTRVSNSPKSSVVELRRVAQGSQFISQDDLRIPVLTYAGWINIIDKPSLVPGPMGSVLVLCDGADTIYSANLPSNASVPRQHPPQPTHRHKRPHPQPPRKGAPSGQRRHKESNLWISIIWCGSRRRNSILRCSGPVVRIPVSQRQPSAIAFLATFSRRSIAKFVFPELFVASFIVVGYTKCGGIEATGSPPWNLSYRVKHRFNGGLSPLTNLSKELV
ncbi:hypothetical protein B0H14DRAFT_3546951 [Mycena olivaceomarginata]|nr:hypothetical protein B0H14DRAFT_3546951 [Mycena olivaceomarginata]